MTNRITVCGAVAALVLGSPALAQDGADPPEAAWTPLFADDGTTAPAARGVWQARGYGHVLEVEDERARMHSITVAGAWEQTDSEVETTWFRPGPEGTAELRIFPEVPGYRLESLPALPRACRVEREWTSVELFVAVMDELYPFFDERGIDWDARVAAARPRVSAGMSELELFRMCASMLENLRDGHVYLGAEIDGDEHRADVGGKGTATRIYDAFHEQEAIEDQGEFVRAWVKEFRASMSERVLRGDAQQSCGDRLVWGRTHDEVGYLYVRAMEGFGGDDMGSELAAVHGGMDEVLAGLADTRALIVDVSMNGGGMDVVSVAIASHFADERRLGFSKYPATAPDLRYDWYVAPSEGARYTKPVYLVINDQTASAAEIFALCMRAFPHVTTVGKPTSGGLSDILDKTLPNGWGFGLSNEVYLDHEGVCHEAHGVPVDVPMDVFDPEDIMRIGHAESIARVVELALDASAVSGR